VIVAEIQKVGVCGCGLMGSGIAQVAATAGCDVVVLEADRAALDRGMAGIRKSLDKFVEKGAIDAATRDAILGRLKTTTDVNDLKDRDLVIEAVIENMAVKKELFSALDNCSRLTPSSVRTRRACASSRWPPRRKGPSKSPDSTSSIRCRS